MSELSEIPALRNGAAAATYVPDVPDPRLESVGVAAVAASVPDRRVATTEVEDRLGLDPGWISSRTGVAERRVAAEDESLVDLASAAALSALERARVAAASVDLVLVATLTPDDLQPHASPLIAERIGACRAGAIDVGAACTGFVSGLALAAAQIEARRARTVLVIGAEIMSRVIDPDDRSTAGLFGDGAAAAVIRAGGPGSIGPVVLDSDGSAARHITASHSERMIHMNGRATFRAAVAAISKVTVEAAGGAGFGLDEIDLFVYHQANRRILSAVGERLGLDRERVFDCIDRFGNTSAASVPLAISEALDEGRIAAGDVVLIAAFGAGFTWGGTVIEWGEAE